MVRFGLVWFLFSIKWFGLVWFGFKAKKLNRNRNQAGPRASQQVSRRLVIWSPPLNTSRPLGLIIYVLVFLKHMIHSLAMQRHVIDVGPLLSRVHIYFCFQMHLENISMAIKQPKSCEGTTSMIIETKDPMKMHERIKLIYRDLDFDDNENKGLDEDAKMHKILYRISPSMI